MRRFNLEEFLWLLILIFMDLGIIYLIYTGKTDFYIGDKMAKYMYMSVLLLTILILFQIANVFTPKGDLNIINKLLPIMIAIILGFISVKAQDSFRHNELYDNLLSENEEVHEHNFGFDKKKKDDYIRDGNIVINDNNLELLEDMKNNPEEYIGKNLEVKGFVCKDSLLEENMFMIGRVQMTCCAADSKVIGILAEYEDSKSLNENDWVNIKGSISYTTINDDDGISHRVPVVHIGSLEKVENEDQK